MIKSATSVLAAAAVLSLTACGSSGGGSSSAPASSARASSASASSPSATASTSTAAASGSTSRAASATGTFCAGLQPHGEGPADAFMVIATYSASEAHTAAKDQLALMAGVPTPPQQIAADWTAWKSYLSLVLKDSAKPGAGSSLAGTLSGPATKVESSRKKLENYAFAHCK